MAPHPADARVDAVTVELRTISPPLVAGDLLTQGDGAPVLGCATSALGPGLVRGLDQRSEELSDHLVQGSPPAPAAWVPQVDQRASQLFESRMVVPSTPLVSVPSTRVAPLTSGVVVRMSLLSPSLVVGLPVSGPAAAAAAVQVSKG